MIPLTEIGFKRTESSVAIFPHIFLCSLQHTFININTLFKKTFLIELNITKKKRMPNRPNVPTLPKCHFDAFASNAHFPIFPNFLGVTKL
jgi:hypothetical protein